MNTNQDNNHKIYATDKPQSIFDVDLPNGIYHGRLTSNELTLENGMGVMLDTVTEFEDSYSTCIIHNNRLHLNGIGGVALAMVTDHMGAAHLN